MLRLLHAYILLCKMYQREMSLCFAERNVSLLCREKCLSALQREMSLCFTERGFPPCVHFAEQNVSKRVPFFFWKKEIPSLLFDKIFFPTIVFFCVSFIIWFSLKKKSTFCFVRCISFSSCFFLQGVSFFQRKKETPKRVVFL